MPSHDPSAAAAINISVTIPSSGRLRVVSVAADTLPSSPRPMNAAPTAIPPELITQASSAAIRTSENERMAVTRAAMRRIWAPAKRTSHQPGDGGTLLPFARKKPYQTSEPASQSVAAQAQRSHVGRRSSEARATVNQATNGTGRTAMLKTRLDVWRGAPARVAPRYARNSATATTASRRNLRSPAERDAGRSHSDSYTLIQTPRVEASPIRCSRESTGR